MRIAGLTALAAGALILPATLAPTASAEVEDITIYAWGSEMPVACDYVGANCTVMARMFGADYALPATLTINGRELDSAERLDYPDRQRSALRGTWRPPAKGTYTIVATQGSSTKTLVLEVTGDAQLGSGSAGFPSGSS
ncbi:hypothetical protein [Nocardia caishijiensis]|uniref:Ig-like domain-containing protein n=1 Tax=Nocardia caishijiensis TaxID=184756 RepID=A0ABQ6YGA4_9NOCA|nr:hypothetical protein [Nocardia caishijiensis]KAF0844829.1 hypothetical protein FNL39_11061 [Nocardia caishijiensis]